MAKTDSSKTSKQGSRSGSASSSKSGAKSGSKTVAAAKSAKATGSSKAATKADDLKLSAEDYARLERSVSREGTISRIILAVILLAVAAFLIISIYFPYAGKVGEILKYGCTGLFGFMGYILPFFFALFSALLFINRAGELGKLPTVIFLVVFYILASACFAIHCLTDVVGTKFSLGVLKQFWIDGVVQSKGGGLLGSGLAYLLMKLVGTAGGYIVTIAGMIICALITINRPMEWIFSHFKSFRKTRKETRDSIREDIIRQREAAAEEAAAAADVEQDERDAEETAPLSERKLSNAEEKAAAGERAILSATEKKKQKESKWRKYAGYFMDTADEAEEEAIRTEAKERQQARKNARIEGNVSMMDDDDSVSYGFGGSSYFSGGSDEPAGRTADRPVHYKLGLAGDPFGDADDSETGAQGGRTFMSGIDDPYADGPYQGAQAGDRRAGADYGEDPYPGDSIDRMEEISREAAGRLTQELDIPDFNPAYPEEAGQKSMSEDTLHLKRTGRFVPGSTDVTENGGAAGSGTGGKGLGSGFDATGQGTRTAGAGGNGTAASAVKAGLEGAAGAGTAKAFLEAKKRKAAAGETAENKAPKEDSLPYVLPPLTLLKGGGGNRTANTSMELRQKGQLLEKTLQAFNVRAKVINVEKGPSVTRFEVQPDVGVKVSSIVNLQNDIALNLRAKSIRIEAPIPGKAAIGIEIENEHKNPVCLKDVIDTPQFRNSKSKITFAVGRDISGNPIVANLKDMPHLLIAGSTGSGKSVCINSIILSILYKARPDEVKMVMIDPKVVELGNYNGIPHLMIPVVNEPSKAAVALNWAVKEMEERYRRFREYGVKDLASYNDKAKKNPDIFTMPQIVIIIDELADLMMAAPQQVEDAICRLAQMARAAGMHLIVATQRPSVDVITGVIKANMPSRIAFAVSSQVDSRTILDTAGAEKLLGKGDMLFNPLGMGKPLRVQGTFVEDGEIADVISFVSGQYGHEADFSNDLMDTIQNQSPGYEDEDADELLPDAIEMVIEMGQASASMIQRKFRVGYNRAARMVDMMEERGIVGPADGSRPRTVLLTREEYEALRSGSSSVDYPDDYEGGDY